MGGYYMESQQTWSGAKLHEEIVFNYLATRLPKEYIFINNRRLKGNGQFREFDLILLGKYAVYIVEIKHIIGSTIKGNNHVWRLESYFEKSGIHEIKSPLRQLWEQELLLEKRIAESGLKVAIVDCVCILSDERPRIYIDDAKENLEKIFWYKDLEGFLTDYQRIPERLRTKYKIDEKTDIFNYHQRLIEMIDSNFTIRTFNQIGQYEIESEAWRTRRYTAYYAHPKEKKLPSKRVLLKLYKLIASNNNQSNTTASKKEINDFVTKLNGRANAASSMLSQDGNPGTGGDKYVLAGQSAFPVYEENAFAVVSDWIEGQPLSYFLKNLPSSKYLNTIAAQICRGLAFIHSAKVFHRNLTTDNIIWSSSDREIRITNFHFARLIGKKTILLDERILDDFVDETAAMQRYQAPELRNSNPLQQMQPENLYHQANASTDIYSLGVILLELFGGLFSDNETVEDRIKEIGHLNSNIKNIIETFCSLTPSDRIKIGLVEAAETFERLAGSVLPDQDLFNLRPGTSLGFYEIIKTLEITDLSVVYLAKYVLSPENQKVVIKVHKSISRGKTIRKELWDAIQIISEIDNQFTAQLLQTNKAYLSDGKVLLQPVSGAHEAYYQIWEYIDGQDLDTYLNTLNPYLLENATKEQLDERFLLAVGVLQALSALHQKKWTHRDIKPKNFMRTPQSQIKIIDFGLSKRSGDAQIVLGGTPCYIPPEAYSNNEWSETGDVWAAGCLVTYILTGEEICAATNADQQVVTLRGIDSKLGPNVIQVLKKAVQNIPENRYPSAIEFSQDFLRVYEDWKSKPSSELEKNSNPEGKEMIPMNYTEILKSLNEQREDAIGLGDMESADEIASQVRLLERWLADGEKGPCPVDLGRYGLGQVAASTQVSKEETPTVQIPIVVIPAGVEIEHIVTEKVEPDQESLPGLDGLTTEHVDEESIATEERDRVQDNLRESLEQVRQYIRNKEWHEAVALAVQVENLAHGEVRETAGELRAQAQIQLNEELQRLLADGDAARSQGDMEEARKLYRAALVLENANSHARLALQELDGRAQEKVSREQQQTLRAGLKERRDIHRLGEAVYDAEALDGEGRLPEELAELLKDARDYYDKTRQQMGEETTAMRYGDVTLRADAVARLQARVASGVRTIYDQTTDTDRPAFDVLREAQELLRQASEDMAQYEINIAEKLKTIRPRYVRQRMAEALGKPLQEQEKHRLEEKLSEVDQYIQRQEKSESLQEQATGEADPVLRLGILLQAYKTFGAIAGLEEQVSQTRPIAIAVMQAGIHDGLRRAELQLHAQKYDNARTATTEVEEQIARWPEEPLAGELTQLLSEARELRQWIDVTEQTWMEYSRMAETVRQRVADPSQRGAGLALFKQVSEEERFKAFPDLKILTSEIDQYKGVGEQLDDAMAAREKGDWSRVFEIADKVLRLGTAGKLTARFQELHADAVTELNIQRAQELIENDEIPEANNILSTILHRERERGVEREKIVRERLAGELSRIQEAIRSSSSMQPLYDQACTLLNLRDDMTFKAFTSPSFALRQSKVGADGEVSNPQMRALVNRVKGAAGDLDPTPQELTERVSRILLEELTRKGMAERLKALQLFRYVGGDQQTRVDHDGWPPYVLSLRTAEARRAARLVAESLRRDILQPLMQQYVQLQGQDGGLGEEQLREMAEKAGYLREAYLLETESERVVGRWVEVEWGKRQARQEESQSNWQNAVEIWTRLNNHYPGVPAVKRGLRNARIQDVTYRSYYLLHNDHKGQEAVTLLKKTLAESDMSNSWELYLTISETYSALGEYESSFANLDQVQRVIGGMDEEQQKRILELLARKRAEIESHQIVDTARHVAENRVLAGHPAEAIRGLQTAMEKPKIIDATELKNLQNDIFTQATEQLLAKAREEQDKGTDEGKIQAVTALVDLQILEDLVGLPPEKRRSTVGLNRLRADLASVANAVILAVGDFDPTTMPLQQAIDTATSLSARLQTFDNVIPLFKSELESVGERLSKRRREIAVILDNLHSLDKILQEANHPNLWETAVRTGDFDILQQYLARINKLELSGMQEVRAFDRRLSETFETYTYVLDMIGQVRQKFNVEEDFDFVKNRILGSHVQPPFRQNNQTWQVVHAREYEEIRTILDERLRVPDVYGSGDLVGWNDVLEQAEERKKELEQWREWDRQCEYKMDAAAEAVKVTENHPVDLPTRVKKMDWEKVLATAQSAAAALTYTRDEKFVDPLDEKEKVRVVQIVGVPIPVRSQSMKSIEEEGRRRKLAVDEWIHMAKTKIDALQAVLERRGFPTAEEFQSATSSNDWDHLEKILARAREAGITSEEERKRVETYSRVLEQMRKGKQKKGFKLW
jgi:serine/threonine protein kinase